MKKIMIILFIVGLLTSCASKKKETNWNQTREHANQAEEDLGKETKK